MAGFNTAVTGIKATTTALDVTGNNISNASTVGFKATRAEFGDLYSTQVVGAGSANIAGSGVLISDLAQDFSSGTTEFTNSNLDLAINGSGFFQLDDGQGGFSYTRAGAFELNKDGFIVSKNGKYLRGYGLDAQGNQLPLTNLKVEEKESPPHPTENINLSVNLQPAEDLDAMAAYYSKTNASSYSYTTTIETYDSLGNTQSIKYNYVEQKPQRELHEFSFSALLANGDSDADPLDLVSAEVLSISGIPLEWSTTYGGAAAAPANAPAGTTVTNYLAADSIEELEKADPRIDTTTVKYVVDDAGNGVLTYKLKSSATGQGDVVVVKGDGATSVAQQLSNLTPQGNPEVVEANEVLRLKLAPAHSTNGADSAFDVSGGGSAADDNALRQDVTIHLGGVDILLTAGLKRDDVGKTIVDQHEAAIKENDPNIESVTYDAATDELIITWKPEAGDVYNTGSLFAVEGNVDGAADETLSIFMTEETTADFDAALAGPTAGNAKTGAFRTTTEGDNSYLGVYRLYAYLNDEELLNIGKVVDPGETGNSSAVSNFTDNQRSEPGPIMIKFSPKTGLIEEINGIEVQDQNSVPKLTIRGADRANPNDEFPDDPTDDLDGLRGVQLDLSGSTRWESASIVKDQSQDGYSKGDLIGVSFDERGYMVASYSNGQKQEIGIVALATFENQSGLQPAGDTEWVPTIDSGQASLNPPGTGLNGTIRSGALEQSNVDLSAELVKLIEFQRNYQANSKTLETLNTVTQSILQI